MLKPLYSTHIEIRDTKTVKGRGVFACRDFKKDEIVEVCPVVLFEDYFSLIPDCLQDVVFDGGELMEVSEEGKKGNKEMLAIVLGWGSIYNHENPANVGVSDDPESQTFVFKALKNIAAESELVINYDELKGGISNEDKWFPSRKRPFIDGTKRS